MENNLVLFLDNLEKESDLKYSAIRNFALVNSGKSMIDGGNESFDSILEAISDVTEFIYDNYKSLLDWLATTEIVVDKVVYKTRQNNIRYLQSLIKDNKNISKEITFQEVKNFKIPVITGLKADLHTYIKMLAETNFYHNLADELIYLRKLAEDLIDNNGITQDKQGNKYLDIYNIKNRIKVNTQLVSKIKDDLKKITDGHSVADTKPLNKLVKSLSDIEKVANETVKVGRLYTVEKIENLNKVYKETNEKVESMLNIMEVDKNSSISQDGTTIAVLAKYIHSVAELLSFVSMKFFYYSLLVDTNIAIQVVLKNYAETKDSSTVYDKISSILKGIEQSVSGLMSVFESK